MARRRRGFVDESRSGEDSNYKNRITEIVEKARTKKPPATLRSFAYVPASYRATNDNFLRGLTLAGEICYTSELSAHV
jgi:hypothetical protein